MKTGYQAFPEVRHDVDFCVIGGGMAGICAALAAARHGLRVLLMHDRPVLGGNASSECRVHICGADRHNHIKNMRETGILEELRMENLYRNPTRSFSVWDLILYEKLTFQPKLTLLLNCSCLDATLETGADSTPRTRIASVTGWQLTTHTRQVVFARLFADCSGDGVLAPLTGAAFRMGREARHEFGEAMAPEQADARTMGMTCLFQARRHDSPQPFEAPGWASRFARCEELPYGAGGHDWWQMGYWWIELGGEQNSVYDTERLRDELLKHTLGVWDHIKNHCPRTREQAADWALEWLQFLPAKRESRRYVGDHVLCQGDVEAQGRFPDTVAYGGWSMDDHDPAGFHAVKIGHPATIFHHAPSPFGIPYRSLYSRNIENLFFAGRDASCTHAAMSSTRVMGTGCSMGQAVGTAAVIAIREGLTPRQAGSRVGKLQQMLLADDCYLPGIPQEFPLLTRDASLRASQGTPDAVRDGVNRPVGDVSHAWDCRPGDSLVYSFAKATEVAAAVLILDSALQRNVALSYHQADDQLTCPPPELPKRFRLETCTGTDWQPQAVVERNRARLVRLPVGQSVNAIRFVLDETWGQEASRVFAFWLE